MTSRPVILLAAHGERGGAANNARLAGLVEQVGAAIPDADVGSVLVNVEGVVERTLEACAGRTVVCLPLLFSDGYFFEKRLKPYFSGEGHTLAPPMALWRSFAPFLADNLALRTISHAADPRVKEVMASIAATWEVILVARSDGHMAADVRPLVRLSLSVIMEENGRREQGSSGGGGRFDYAYFTDAMLDEYAKKAVEQALTHALHHQQSKE